MQKKKEGRTSKKIEEGKRERETEKKNSQNKNKI